MTGDDIRTFEIFGRLNAADAEEVARRVIDRKATRGAVLFRQGEPADHLVLLAAGQVKMERLAPDGAVSIVEILGAGHPLAAANFLEQEPYPVTSVALTDVAYGTLTYREFAGCVHRHPDVALALLGYLAKRLHRAYATRRAVDRSSVRLADALSRIAADAPPGPDGTGRVVGLSHGELAEVAGLARETVTRLLRRWEALAWVDLGVREIRIRHLEALEALAQEGTASGERV